MDRRFVGDNFYDQMLDMGENYFLEKSDGEEWVGKLSIIAKTASTYMLAEREHLMTGVATFPDIESQTLFRGCYFKRQINPRSTYILVSTIPKDTTEKVAEVYAIKCNATVSMAFLVEKTNQKFDKVSVPEIYAENVQVYWDSTIQKQRRSSDGNFDQSMYYIQIPAKYGLAQDQVVIRKMFMFNEEKKESELVDVRFRVESVDMSMTTLDEDGIVHGIADVQLSLDTRS